MLYISDFIRDFHKKLYEVAPDEIKRELIKQERVVKHTLYSILGQHEFFHNKDSRHFQERFHVRIDQLAGDYRTWKRAGCKPYAKPKQYITGKVAGASKKAFDQILNTYMVKSHEGKEPIIEDNLNDKPTVEQITQALRERKEQLLNEDSEFPHQNTA